MPVPQFDSVGDQVTFTNAKMYGDVGSHLALQAAQQFGAHNSRMNQMAESTNAMWANRLATPDPSEAISTQKMLTGDDKIDAATVIALAQQMTKTAQTTPPVTP